MVVDFADKELALSVLLEFDNSCVKTASRDIINEAVERVARLQCIQDIVAKEAAKELLNRVMGKNVDYSAITRS